MNLTNIKNILKIVFILLLVVISFNYILTYYKFIGNTVVLFVSQLIFPSILTLTLLKDFNFIRSDFFNKALCNTQNNKVGLVFGLILINLTQMLVNLFFYEVAFSKEGFIILYLLNPISIYLILYGIISRFINKEINGKK
jgi:Na+/proline symporter